MHPFINSRVPISYSISELKTLLSRYDSYWVCLYLSSRKNWQRATSPIYMNQVIDNVLYTPIDVMDDESLTELYDIAKNNEKIVAMNIGVPHKSNDMFRERLGCDGNFDVIIKENHKLYAFDVNGPSFVEWYLDEIGDLTNKNVIIFGVGGAGSAIAKSLPPVKKLWLVDTEDKSKLCEELNAEYASNLVAVTSTDNLVLINATGQDEGLDILKDQKGIFVELRMGTILTSVKLAEECGWHTFKGDGMSLRNDYIIIKKICTVTNQTPITFEKYKILFENAVRQTESC